MTRLSERVLHFFRITEGVSSVHWMLFDALAACFWYYAGTLIILHHLERIPTSWGPLILVTCVLISGNILGLYERKTLLSRIQLILSLLGVTFLSVLGLAVFVNLIVYEQIGRWILLSIASGFFLTALLPRLLGHYAVMLYKIRIMVLGDSDIANRIRDNLEREEDCYIFAGYCCDQRGSDNDALGNTQELTQQALQNNIDVIVVARKYQSHPLALEQCFEVAKHSVEIQDEESFWENFLEQVQIDTLDKGVFYNVRMGKSSRSSQILKRLIDITVAITGLLLTAPILPIIALAIRISSPGSVIFAQKRCGRFGEPFTLFKFRTMKADAEKSGVQWAITDDPRVTKLGALLRKTRLDELPQFWNIIRGDMSLIGPRPERPELVKEIEKSVPYFSLRHWARPGLTGLAQIRFRYAASMEDAREKMRYDLYYIKNWSLFLDIQILLRTISTVMKGSR
jgi:exopolysaccharide biosynthesis polyprenyl glycosylphosphotransferase